MCLENHLQLFDLNVCEIELERGRARRCCDTAEIIMNPRLNCTVHGIMQWPFTCLYLLCVYGTLDQYSRRADLLGEHVHLSLQQR